MLVDNADYADLTHEHELDRTRSGIDSALKGLDHEVRINDLSGLRNFCTVR